MGCLQHPTQVSIIYTHTQSIYITTYYYAHQHKNMLHPPLEEKLCGVMFACFGLHSNTCSKTHYYSGMKNIQSQTK